MMNSRMPAPRPVAPHARLTILSILLAALCLGIPTGAQFAHAHGATDDPPDVTARAVYRSRSTTTTNPKTTTSTVATTRAARSRTHVTSSEIRVFDADDCAPAQALVDSGLVLQAPVVGDISQPFGAYHAGVDWPGAKGDRVRAAHDGEVIFAGWSREGYGYLVTVLYMPVSPTMLAVALTTTATVTVATAPTVTPMSDPVVLKTHYAHLSKIDVAVGAKVKRGQIVGEMGRTGNADGEHLHFEVRLDSVAINPMCFLAGPKPGQEAQL